MATGGRFKYWQSALIVGIGVFAMSYGASRLVETVDNFALVVVYIGVVTAITATLGSYAKRRADSRLAGDV